MIRRAVLLLSAAIVATSCNADVVGPGRPECGNAPDGEVTSATILQLQAVPDAAWGPCIESLRVGWDYVSQFAESGRAVFWLDSDRVGDRFLEVELTPACDPGSAMPDGSPEQGIERFVAITEEPTDIRIAVVPVAERHVADARALVTSIIGLEIEGRRLAPFVVEDEGLAADRIQNAIREVGIVLILDDAEVATGTVEMRRARYDPLVSVTVERALDEVEDDLRSPAYRAQWFYTFEGGCIVYRFNAKGAGAEDIALEIKGALGFYPLGELRNVATDAGFDI